MKRPSIPFYFELRNSWLRRKKAAVKKTTTADKGWNQHCLKLVAEQWKTRHIFKNYQSWHSRREYVLMRPFQQPLARRLHGWSALGNACEAKFERSARVLRRVSFPTKSFEAVVLIWKQFNKKSRRKIMSDYINALFNKKCSKRRPYTECQTWCEKLVWSCWGDEMFKMVSESWIFTGN